MDLGHLTSSTFADVIEAIFLSLLQFQPVAKTLIKVYDANKL